MDYSDMTKAELIERIESFENQTIEYKLNTIKEEMVLLEKALMTVCGFFLRLDGHTQKNMSSETRQAGKNLTKKILSEEEVKEPPKNPGLACLIRSQM